MGRGGGRGGARGNKAFNKGGGRGRGTSAAPPAAAASAAFLAALDEQRRKQAEAEEEASAPDVAKEAEAETRPPSFIPKGYAWDARLKRLFRLERSEASAPPAMVKLKRAVFEQRRAPKEKRRDLQGKAGLASPFMQPQSLASLVLARSSGAVSPLEARRRSAAALLSSLRWPEGQVAPAPTESHPAFFSACPRPLLDVSWDHSKGVAYPLSSTSASLGATDFLRRDPGSRKIRAVRSRCLFDDFGRPYAALSWRKRHSPDWYLAASFSGEGTGGCIFLNNTSPMGRETDYARACGPRIELAKRDLWSCCWVGDEDDGDDEKEMTVLAGLAAGEPTSLLRATDDGRSLETLATFTSPSDVLVCSRSAFRDCHLLGLRNGTALLWDSRVPAASDASLASSASSASASASGSAATSLFRCGTGVVGLYPLCQFAGMAKTAAEASTPHYYLITDSSTTACVIDGRMAQRKVRTLYGYTNSHQRYGGDLSPDGQFFCSAQRDGSVRVWSLFGDGEPVCSLSAAASGNLAAGPVLGGGGAGSALFSSYSSAPPAASAAADDESIGSAAKDLPLHAKFFEWPAGSNGGACERPSLLVLTAAGLRVLES